jgi:subtilisin family serine protease
VWRGEVYGSVRARSLGQNIWLHRVAIDIYPPAPAGAWADENWGLQLLNGGPGSVSVDAWIERDDRYQAVFHGAGINPHRTLGRLACGNKPIAVGSYYGAPADAELRRAAAYSSAGPRRSGIEPNNQQPFLSAPGDGIHAARSKTRDVWTVKSGTSMAAAHVSGVIALLLQQDDSLNIDAIKAMLRQTCRGNLPDPPDFELQPAGPPGPWDPQNWDQQYGHGRIDATATLIADGP